jgi:hypothetical protein
VINDDLERIYQQAIAKVPRSKERDNGFLESDLINKMTKRMTVGTDREKWLAAAALIERKTQEGTTKQEGFLNLGEGREPYPYEPERLMRWDGWLIEWKNMTLPWMDEQHRQANDQVREAQAELHRYEAERNEVMELFSGLPNRESLTILKACNIKYRQGSELACKWLLRLHSADYLLHGALQSAAVAAHPNWRETRKGHYRMVDKSQPDNFDDLVNWFQVTHPLKAREVNKAVLDELSETEKAIAGAIAFEMMVLAVDDSFKPDPDRITDRALKLAADAGHVVDRDRIYFLITNWIEGWGPDDWKLPDDDDDDDPDGPEVDPSPIGGELVSC